MVAWNIVIIFFDLKPLKDKIKSRKYNYKMKLKIFVLFIAK